MRGIMKDLHRAYSAAQKAAGDHDGSMYGKGLAHEGYTAGYMAALRDVEAALRGYVNNNSRYWPQD